VSLVMSAVVLAFRLTVDDPQEPILFFLVVPIGLIAFEFGIAGGALAAGFASLIMGVWDLSTDSNLTPYGYVARGTLFLLSGLTVGSLSRTRKELEAHSTHWFEQSPDFNCVADLEGRLIRVNQAWIDTFGYSKGQINPDGMDGSEDLMSRLAGNVSVQFENRYRTVDDGYIWLRWVLTKDLSRGFVYATAHDVTPMKELEIKLRDQSQTDPLTGLSNRRHFESEARRQLDFLARYGHRGALFVLDVDRFKTINDNLGHKVGDQALITLAHAIKNRIRQVDLAARIGGDEFAILFPEVGENGAHLLAAALRDAIRGESISLDEPLSTITSSIGIALFESNQGLDLDAILADADQAMYEAKRAGGDGFSVAKYPTRIETP
jgi:diguanylate cyclase (GGDEF)-like protein/PAS domain S-box-containing protein